MSVTNATWGEADLLVSAPEASFDLAASTLSKHLNMTLAAAQRQLCSGRLTLPPGDASRRLLSLLRSMGIMVAPSGPERHAVNIRLPRPSDRGVATVARILQRDRSAVAVALRSPWGMILSDLPKVEADRLTHTLRHHPGIVVATVANSLATADIFAPQPIAPRFARKLNDYMALRGLTSCRTSGALIGAVDLGTARQIIARFDDCGLLALPRAFQRFDLMLTGLGSLTAAEAMDFLLLRGDQSGRMAQSITAMTPLQVETDLGRSAAMAFCADYAAIGLEVSLRLMVGNS